MKYTLLALAFTLALLHLAAAQDDKEESVGDVKVKIFKKGAKIMIDRDVPASEAKDGKARKDKVILELGAFSEKKKGGDEPKGKGGKQGRKNGVKDLTKQVLTVSDASDAKIPDSDVDARLISMGGTLDGLTSKIKLNTYIAKGDGTVKLADEEADLKAGKVKMTLELSDWQWCSATDCDEAGEYVDVELNMQTPGKPAKREGTGKEGMKKKGGKKGGEGDGEKDGAKKDAADKRKPPKYDVGEGISLELSEKVKLDDTDWVDMPEGYPKLEERGANKVIVCRFPKFNKKAYYDPAVDMKDSASSVSMSVVGWVLVAVVTLFAR